MNKKENMDAYFLVFSDLMLFSSIPVLIGGGIWETNLALSVTGHTLALLAILLVVLRWDWFWFSLGENRRLRFEQDLRDNLQQKSPTRMSFNLVSEKNLFEETSEADGGNAKDTNNKKNLRNYDANH